MKEYGAVEVYIYKFWIWKLDGGEWSALFPVRCTLPEVDPGTYWTEGWVGLRAGLVIVKERTIFASARNQIPFLLSSAL